MSSYEERMENLKEKEIAKILKAYKWERPISPELRAEIDEFFGMMGYGCWFGSWLSSRIWSWLMVEWTKNDEELINPIHWEDYPSDSESEEEEEEVWYGGCPECGEPQNKPFESCCADCVIRRNREFDEMVEMVDAECEESDEELSKEFYDLLEVEKYKSTLTETEKIAMEIAEKHMGSSFDIRKSNGFLEYKAQLK